MLTRLWSDERGAIVSAELVLVATVLLIGCTVGLVSVRDAIVQQAADFAYSLQSLNQSYSISPVVGPYGYTAGSYFNDRTAQQFNSTDRRQDYRSWEQPACIIVGEPHSVQLAEAQ